VPWVDIRLGDDALTSSRRVHWALTTLRGMSTLMSPAAQSPSRTASLSAPVKGLGLAFGTSVAGVAASATIYVQ